DRSLRGDLRGGLGCRGRLGGGRVGLLGQGGGGGQGEDAGGGGDHVTHGELRGWQVPRAHAGDDAAVPRARRGILPCEGVGRRQGWNPGLAASTPATPRRGRALRAPAGRWPRGWDSNPRYPRGYAAFRVRC